MTQNTFSITFSRVIKQLGEPAQEEEFEKGNHVQIIAKWHCGCEFHETEQGSGILFTCDEHAG